MFRYAAFGQIKRPWILGLFLACMMSAVQQAHAAKSVASSPDSTGVFDQQDVLAITLTSDFKSIMNDRGEDRGYHKGALSYIDYQGDTIRRKLRLKTRGNFRRDPENCKYPPIKIKFGKLKGPDPLFSNQTKLKLVTECQNEQYILREYTAYLLYKLISPYSYRTRLAKITYQDKITGQKYFTRYAFFIENENHLADRLKAEIYKKNAVQYMLTRQNALRMAFFQYMIGNNDWFVTSKHNVTILKLSQTHELIAVPYDFDFSKLVDADYTRPQDIPAYLVKDKRSYKGLCLTKEDLENQITFYDAKRSILEKQINNTPGLSRADKKHMINYIGSFYKILHKPNSLQQIFQQKPCVVAHDLKK